MALHDLWHFENAPVGMTLSAAGSSYNGNTIYNQYTGNVGQPLTYVNNTTPSNIFSVTADGFLSNAANSSGQCGALFVPTAAVQDWSVATQYWFGFRTKLIVNNTLGAPHVVIVTNSTSFGSWTSLLDESHLIAAGMVGVGGEIYIEVFIDRSALTFQVYGNGVLINSGTVTSAVFNSTGYITFGGASTGSANYARGYRDFYFLDVDASTPGRLGPIRAKASRTAAASGSEWVPNGAADLVTVLNTANQNPPVISPYAQAPADNQSLAVTMGVTVNDSSQKVLAVQPTLSFQPSGAGPAKIAASFADASSNVSPLGQFANSNGLVLNQKLPWQTKAPDGSNWTGAKINQTQFVLTPTN
jgi:hypothetical protein